MPKHIGSSRGFARPLLSRRNRIVEITSRAHEFSAAPLAWEHTQQGLGMPVDDFLTAHRVHALAGFVDSHSPDRSTLPLKPDEFFHTKTTMSSKTRECHNVWWSAAEIPLEPPAVTTGIDRVDTFEESRSRSDHPNPPSTKPSSTLSTKLSAFAKATKASDWKSQRGSSHALRQAIILKKSSCFHGSWTVDPRQRDADLSRLPALIPIFEDITATHTTRTIGSVKAPFG